jgi:NADH dehydrogenase FAD-containing subunit
LQAALGLRRRAGVELTLVDRRSFHLFQPAPASLSYGTVIVAGGSRYSYFGHGPCGWPPAR